MIPYFSLIRFIKTARNGYQEYVVWWYALLLCILISVVF